MSEQEPTSAKKKLNEEEHAQVAEWYEQHGEKVIQEVRRWLRKVTRERTSASSSAVAQSVWASFMEKHLDEVDTTDANSAWAVLAKAAKRHCEAWNKEGYRHRRRFSIDTETGGEPPAGLDLPDASAASPEVVVMVNECSNLFRFLDDSQKLAIGQSLVRLEDSIGLVEHLGPAERDVLGLKLAGKTRPEIAMELGIYETEVDQNWRGVRRKAESLGTDPPV